MAAKRFWLPATGTVPVSVANDASWTATALQYAAGPLVANPSDTAMASRGQSSASTALLNTIFGQWVSQPLAAQVIPAQTFKLQNRCNENNLANNLFLCVVVRVCSLDGGTIRGTLLAATVGATELPQLVANRAISATTSALTVVNGDRLVVEIGNSGDPGAGNHNSTHHFGDPNSGTDLPEDESTTTNDRPWCQFSAGVELWSPRGAVNFQNPGVLG